MMNASLDFLRSRLSALSAQASIVGAVAVVGVLAGVAPQYDLQSRQLTFSAAAHAQDCQNVKVTDYARAVYEVELLRRDLFGDVKKIMGGNVPGNVCKQSNLPQNVRDICAQFEKRSSDIVQKKYQMSPAEFNQNMRQVSQQDLQAQVNCLGKGSR